jgi:hypothetical protein
MDILPNVVWDIPRPSLAWISKDARISERRAFHCDNKWIDWNINPIIIEDKIDCS